MANNLTSNSGGGHFTSFHEFFSLKFIVGLSGHNNNKEAIMPTMRQDLG